MKTRILFTVLLLSGLFLFCQGIKTGNAAEFPSRPVELILSGSPGGATDIGVRVIGPALSKELGVPVIFTNKGGASGALSAEYVARAKPDGYTILAASGNVFTVIPVMNPSVPYRLSNFIPICKYANSPPLFVVRKASPFKRLEDLISYAKKNPGKLTCGTAGTGTTSQLCMEMFKIEAGLDIVHMPTKSGGEDAIALLGGQVDFTSHAGPPILGLVQSGEARCLAVASDKRLSYFPDVPTLGEFGYPKANTLLYWLGFYLPKETPKPVVDKLASVFEKAIKTPTVKEGLEKVGDLLDYQDGPTLAKFIPEEYKIMEELFQKTKLTK